MTLYTLTVTRHDDNPNYDAEKERERARFGYMQQHVEPPTHDREVLRMVVDASQFNAIRKAALEAAS